MAPAGAKDMEGRGAMAEAAAEETAEVAGTAVEVSTEGGTVAAVEREAVQGTAAEGSTAEGTVVEEEAAEVAAVLTGVQEGMVVVAAAAAAVAAPVVLVGIMLGCIMGTFHEVGSTKTAPSYRRILSNY
ncbi:uncharacterized protein LOC109704416 [Ananas comosus]|uniref:Uncharacterized protein LOC109704416 n=1 Tax=Ananas comosus TaxID=4615 RepID=A0A6P5EBT5_ANACO|nr:uncharacterized protein LOC109704416 [Ananas comosus]